MTFPRQTINYKDGYFYPSISRETKPHFLTEIKLDLPGFIDSDWVKEVTRGLYQSRHGYTINPDCNGTANIMKKVATQLGLNLVEVGRASLTVPQRYDLFRRLNKSYRQRCVVRILSGVATSAKNPLCF